MEAVGQGKLDSPAVSEKNRAMLRYVEKLTLRPGEMRDTDAQAMRAAGWTDEEIFETSFITALFAFFNRMADAYGLDYPMNGWLPEELRPARAPGN